MDDPVRHNTHDGTYYEWHGAKGPVMVLIHGLGLNRQMWQWQIPALSKAYRVLSYDLLGHGQSTGFDRQADLKLFSGQLNGLLSELGIEQCAVVGFSLGGMIARRFAMDYPQKIQALAVLNSPHARSIEQQKEILKRVQQADEQGPSATVDAALERWFTDRYKRANPDVMDLVKSWVLANDPKSFQNSYRVLALGVEELVNPQPPIRCPALVVTADDDPGQTAPMAKAIAAEMEDAEVIIVPGYKHMAVVEVCEQFNQMLLAFFERTLRTADEYS